MTIPQLFCEGRPLQFVCALLLAAVALVALPNSTHAADGQVWGGLAVANANDGADGGQWGPGAQLGFRAGISDFWSFVGGVDTSYHFSSTDDDLEVPSAEVLGLFGGFRYNLDIFQYIPYVGLSLVNFAAAPPTEPGEEVSRVAAKLSVGVDWRYSREWSVGGVVELHAPLDEPDAFPFYSTLGVNLAYHFRL